MDAGIDPRNPTTAAAARSGSLSPGITSPTEMANAAADAEWPEGNEVVDGIATHRLSGTQLTTVRAATLAHQFHWLVHHRR